LKVTAPDGTRWKVGRQWWPDRDVDTLDAAGELGADAGGDGGWFPDLGDADAFVVVIVAIGVVLLTILFITTVVIPVIAFTLELMLLLVLFFAGIAGRLLFRKPWTVRARADGLTRHRWQVVGFRNSGELRDEVAAALSSGRALPISQLPR
jgi:hypothetical protein